MRKFLGKISVLLLLIFYCTAVNLVDAQQKHIKVGFFPLANLSQQISNPTPPDYDVEYLNEIAKYTNWEYEYIFFRTGEAAFAAMRAQQIDLIGSVQKTASREEMLVFGDYPVGVTYEAIFADQGSDFSYEHFAAFDGKKIGWLTSYIRKPEFLHYAKKSNFSGKMVEFNSMEDMRSALHQKKIDLLIANWEDRIYSEKVVAQFAPSPYFYVTYPGNTQFWMDFNQADAEIRRRTPEFSAKLRDKYFPRSRQLFLSKDEMDFIQTSAPITIGLLAERRPMSYYDSEKKQMRGILVDLLNEMARYSGLKFNYVPIVNHAPIAFVKEGQADLVAGIVAAEEDLVDAQLRLSDVMLECTMGMVGRHGDGFEPNGELRIAIPKAHIAYQDYVFRNFPKFEVDLCADNEAAGIDALQNHQADVTIQNSYVLTRMMQSHAYENLAIIPTINAPERLCIGALSTGDPRLISIINKSISALSQAQINQCIVNNTVNEGASLTLHQFFNLYKYHLAIAFFLLLSIVYSLYLKNKNARMTRKSENVLKNITNNITGGVITLIADQDFTITYANDGFLDLIGYTRAEYDKHAKEIGLSYIHPDDLASLQELINVQDVKKDKIELEFRVVQRNGLIIPSLFRGTIAKDEQGRSFYYCVVVDISEQKKMIQALELEKERYRVITDQADDIIFEINVSTQQIDFSTKYEQIFGSAPARNIENALAMIHPEDHWLVQEAYARIEASENYIKENLRIRKANGSYLWCALQLTAIREQGMFRMAVGKITNIDEEKRERDQLKGLAEKDALTGLYNKKAMYDLIHFQTKGSGAMKNSDLLFIDIDNFKSINDSFGHLKGDEVLIEIAKKMQYVFRKEDVLSRFGGDEFCIFIQGLTPKMLADKAERLRESIYQIYEVNGKSVCISASIGIASYPKDASQMEDLSNKADWALYCAKESGKNQVVYYHENLVLKGYKGNRS